MLRKREPLVVPLGSHQTKTEDTNAEDWMDVDVAVGVDQGHALIAVVHN